VDRVRELIPKLIGIPPGVHLGITLDQSVYIRQAIQSLWHEALQGSGLAFLVILIFLRSLTSTLIISIAIPLSILLSFICLYFLEQTLNVFTLGGLALAVGRLVDDSIVELENINRHLNIPGTSRRRAVLDAAREVAMPIFSATITTIIVFLPTVFLEGQIKLLFIPLTFTISVSLFASFLVSRTVTPLLALRVLRPEAPIDPESRRARDRVFRMSQRFFEGTEELYQRLIEWALGRRRLVVGSIAVAFVASLFLVAAPLFGLRPLIGTEFFPPSDEAQFRIDLKAPIGTRSRRPSRRCAAWKRSSRQRSGRRSSSRSCPTSASRRDRPRSSRATAGRTAPRSRPISRRPTGESAATARSSTPSGSNSPAGSRR
jgi:multidrug efflux pump subunit AcrB